MGGTWPSVKEPGTYPLIREINTQNDKFVVLENMDEKGFILF
jgi:hypothetical protein